MSIAKKGKPPFNKGIPMSIETKRKVSESKMGSIPWNKGKRTGIIPWNKGKGNKTTDSQRIRTSKEYKIWRTAVFERDGFTCIWCNQKGVKLNADHIKPFAYYPELRFAIDNGRTLCEPCHRTTNNFGGRGRRIKDCVASA